jgi:hypothetical protein
MNGCNLWRAEQHNGFDTLQPRVLHMLKSYSINFHCACHIGICYIVQGAGVETFRVYFIKVYTLVTKI